MRAWLSVVRPRSGLLTTFIVSLLWCVKVDTLGTPCEKNLDQTYYYFIYFYITDKLHFYFLISFWYPHFLLLPTNPLAHNWELSPPFLLACHSKHLFCPFQRHCQLLVSSCFLPTRVTTPTYTSIQTELYSPTLHALTRPNTICQT